MTPRIVTANDFVAGPDGQPPTKPIYCVITRRIIYKANTLDAALRLWATSVQRRPQVLDIQRIG